MKYLFRDRLEGGRALAAFLKESSNTHPDHHDYHPHFEIYFRKDPLPQVITLNGEELRLDSPALVLTAPFQIHAMSPAEADCPRYERHIFYFSEGVRALLEDLLPPRFLTDHTNCLFPLTEAEAAELAALLPMLFDGAQSERERILALALLLARLDRLVSPERRRRFGQVNVYIPQVLQYLHDHAEESLGAEEIARRFHISRAKLNRDFRASVGTSLHSTVMDIRLSKAMVLLKDTELTVAEISVQCGFPSVYYFHAFFKRMTGKTPLQHREAVSTL